MCDYSKKIKKKRRAQAGEGKNVKQRKSLKKLRTTKPTTKSDFGKTDSKIVTTNRSSTSRQIIWLSGIYTLLNK